MENFKVINPADEVGIKPAVGTLLPLLIATYLPPAGLLAGIITISRWKGINDVMLRSDPATATGAPFYTGFLSNVGVVVWCVGAVLCLYTWVLLREASAEYRRMNSFLLGAGLITALMLFDDLFMLHESFFPRFFKMQERFVLGVYASTVLIFFAAHYRALLRTDYRLVVIAGFFLGLSIIVDQVPFFYSSLPRSLQGWLEDGTKLLGIFGWCGYLARTSLAQLRPVLTRTAQ